MDRLIDLWAICPIASQVREGFGRKLASRDRAIRYTYTRTARRAHQVCNFRFSRHSLQSLNPAANDLCVFSYVDDAIAQRPVSISWSLASPPSAAVSADKRDVTSQQTPVSSTSRPAIAVAAAAACLVSMPRSMLMSWRLSPGGAGPLPNNGHCRFCHIRSPLRPLD